MDSVLLISPGLPDRAAPAPGESAHAGGDWFVADRQNPVAFILPQPADALAEFSPLVVHGPHGCGKSVLARLIVRQIAVQSRVGGEPGFALTMTIREMDRRVRHAAVVGHLEELIAEWERPAICLIDDYHTFSGSPLTDQTLVRLLDQRQSTKRITIVAGCLSPARVSTFSDRLRSRLASGLSIPVRELGVNGRRAFAIAAAERWSLAWDPAALDAVVESSLRFGELAGFLDQLAQCSDPPNPIGLDDVLPAITPAKRSPPAASRILSTVARHFRLKRSELTGPSRRQTLVRARGLAICLLRDLGQLKWKSIARLAGRLDHSTALHAYRKTKRLLTLDPLLADAHELLNQELSAPAGDA